MKDLIAPSDLIAMSWENLTKHVRAYSEFAVWIAAIGLVQFVLLSLLSSLVDDKATYLSVRFLVLLPTRFALLAMLGALAHFTLNAVQKKSVDVRRSLAAGAHHLISLLWIMVLGFLAVFGGMLLFLIPMFIFYIWYKFAMYNLFTDDIRGTAALRESKALVDGRWWSVMWRVAIPMVFVGIALYFVLSLSYLVIGSVLGNPRMFFIEQTTISNVSTTYIFVTTVLPHILATYGAALLIGTQSTLFFDLKKKR